MRIISNFFGHSFIKEGNLLAELKTDSLNHVNMEIGYKRIFCFHSTSYSPLSSYGRLAEIGIENDFEILTVHRILVQKNAIKSGFLDHRFHYTVSNVCPPKPSHVYNTKEKNARKNALLKNRLLHFQPPLTNPNVPNRMIYNRWRFFGRRSRLF